MKLLQNLPPLRHAIAFKNRFTFLFLVFSFLFTVNATAQNCSVNAGIPTTICQGDQIVLMGNAAGIVTSGTVAWSIVSQPGSVVIANPGSLLTNAGIASVPGTYVFRLSATCGIGSATNDVTYTVATKPSVPVQSGTSSFTCYTGSPITISGTAPGGGEFASWSVVGGTSGTFGSPGSATTTFTPSFPVDECSANPYEVTINYSISNASGCKSSVNKTYYFARNYGLSATAYPASVCGTTATLKGSCPGTGTSAWTFINKPGGAPDPAFENAGSRITGVSNLQAGSYTFRYTVTGGCSPGTTDVTVSVAGSVPLTSPNAGGDQYYCSVPGTISLTGNNNAVGENVTWTKIGGGTAVTISNPSSNNTSVSGLTNEGAPYTFTYNIGNGACSSTDTVTIYKIPEPTLTPSTQSLCSQSVPASTTMGPIFGTYRINALDTVKITFTYLSGPAGAYSNVSLSSGIDNWGGNDIPGSFSYLFTATGESKSWSISGSKLYAIVSGADPATALYYLSNRFSLYEAGTYRFRVSYATKCNSYETEAVIFRGLIGSGVNAGTDQSLICNTTSTALAGNLSNGSGQWVTMQMPAGATNPFNATNQNSMSPSINGLISGTYVFRYSYNNGPTCATDFYDDVKVVVANAAPATPNAGADRTTCAGSVSFSGSAIPDNATALWTVVSPGGSGVTFNDATIANPIANGLQPSTSYTFRYTLSNGCGSSFDEVTITTTASSNPPKPTLSSGYPADCSSMFVSLPSSNDITLTHPATPGGITATWTILSSPAGIGYTVTPVNSTSTKITFNVTQISAVSIIYKFSNSTCPTEALADTFSVAFKNSNEYFISAGSPQQLCNVSSYPASLSLTGSSSSLPVRWTNFFSSNGQTATIGTPAATTTSVSLPADGMYRFHYEVASPLDAACPNLGEAYTQVTTSSPGSTALAGDDISFCGNNGVTNLAATALASGTGQWQIHSVEKGVAPVIATPSSATSQITFSQSGSVILKWNSFGPLAECGPSSSDLVKVIYIAPANAGNDQQLCKSTSANLNALAASPATGTWSQISGAAATIADAASAQTVVTGLTTGSYTFRWTVTSPPTCSSTDDVTIVVSSTTEVANAGTNFASCSGGSNTASLAATAAPAGFTGTWALFSKPDGATTGSFSNINSPTSRYNGLTTQGKYVFAWTISNGVCSSTDYVEVLAGASACTLPVELSRFTGSVDALCNVVLNWQSESEQNVLKYSIERAEDGVNYQTISEIVAAGNSSTRQQYNFTDNKISASEYFYRLKMIDRDGSFKYSGVVRISIGCFKTNSLSVLPNPVQKGHTFKIRVTTDQPVTKGVLKIKSITGQTIHTYPVVVKAGTTIIDYPSVVLNAGTYLVDFSENNKQISNCKIVVQ